MRRLIKALVAVVSLSAMAAIVTPSTADASRRDVDVQVLRHIEGFGVGDRVIPSVSVFQWKDDGVKTDVFTRATPGTAYTLWYLVFNAPENCVDGCGRHNIFNPDATFNVERIQDARISVVFAGDGGVADQFGFLRLRGSLDVGEVPGGGDPTEQKVVIGRAEDGALQPLSPVSGIEDLANAEIHIVVRAHGPAFDDPDLLARQIDTFAVCSDPDGNADPGACYDAQTAGHRR